MRLRRMSMTAMGTAVVLASTTGIAGAQPGSSQPGQQCSPGARTLSQLGDHVYPETGNGGYRSVHTDVHLYYDAPSNQLLPGTHVDLSDVATQCLTNFSLDFQRTSAAGPDGPALTVQRVTINGNPVFFTFVQPTYPGDPNGVNDPDPRAHEAGQQAIVGGPDSNPLPPACEPELTADDPDGQDGEQCPANKLLITPAHPLPAGQPFVVSVTYSGRPGVHVDGDGSTEGWFRSDSPAGDGGFVTTEPVGAEAWMPLNDHPSAKPTYDFYDTVNAGKTAVGNGILVSSQRVNDPRFPHGATLWHWHMASPVANYLVENSVGSFDMTQRIGQDGRHYYEFQPSSLSASDKAANLAVMSQQEDITHFQSYFNGPFPFASDGVLIGLPDASFAEEMESMITFPGGTIDLDTFNHENMHQWWGDNVTEANYNLTFFKEGMATVGEFLFAARNAATTAGGLNTQAGRAAFQASLVQQFNDNYARTDLWSGAPSNPTAYTLFDGSSTYDRPGTAYLALRQILGSDRFNHALQEIQHWYGGGVITEAQLEAGFARWLPRPSTSCRSALSTFFAQWFDTDYPTAGGATKPTLTGPGLDGAGFPRWCTA